MVFTLGRRVGKGLGYHKGERECVGYEGNEYEGMIYGENLSPIYRYNDIVLGLIIDSLSPKLYIGQVYSKIAFDVWEELEEAYDKMDGSVIFNVIHKIKSMKHGDLSVPDYYHRLNQLLMGLNDVYQPIRSNVLSKYPLHDVIDAFNIVYMKESHMGLHHGSLSCRNMMNGVEIENLTIKQYLMLTQENLAHGMDRTKSSRIITKDIENMTIAEYMEYEAAIKRDPEGYAQSYTRSSGPTTLEGIEEEEDNSKTLPCQLPPKEINPGSFTLPCTISNPKLYDMANLGAGVNVMPKSLFKHVKLAYLKETIMVVEMENMTKKTPLGIMENILVKIDKPFLETIQAQIDVFRREISLGIGEEKVKFDMNGGICHSRVPVEKFYMESSVQESKNFNPLEIENDVFSYDSHAYSLLEQGTPSYSEESIDNVDSSHDMQELEVKNEYELKAGRNRYALDEVWEKCEKFHDTTKLWYDKGFEEEELWQNRIEDIDYTPPLVKSETFEVHLYTSKNRKSFISITKQMDYVITLGRVNGSRFMEKTRKEMDKGKRTTRKT
uniref:Uncharacterized protein n=1 Tax=Tanacetum cinerariifolium TaxID=118510 RepID=A0A6L2M4W8_TANCI|nr:hypothetical protein [Tanacetum cinerariifolium]